MLLYTHPLNDAREARGAAAGELVLAQRLRPRRASRQTATVGRRSTNACATRAGRGLGRLGRGLASAGRRRHGRAGAALARGEPHAHAVRRTACPALRHRAAGHAVAAAGAARGAAVDAAACWRRCEHARDSSSAMCRRASAFALEQAGVHPLLARLFAARGVRQRRRARRRPGPPAAAATPAGRRRAAARLLADAIAQRRAPVRGGRLRLRRRHRLRRGRCAACACSARSRSTLHYVVPDRAVHGYGLTPAIVDLALQQAARRAGDGGQRHRQPRRRGPCARARPEVLVTDHHLPARGRRRCGCPRPTSSSTPTSPAATSPARPWPAWA